MAYRLVLRSPAGEQNVSLDRTLVVGRDPACDVTIDSVRVSRRHAEFRLSAEGVSVHDLGSRNGVVVNGTRVEQAVVGATDRILLGDVAVTLSIESGLRPADAPGPEGGSAGFAPAPIPPVAPPSGPAPAPSAFAGHAAIPPPLPAQQDVPPAWPPDPGASADKTTILPRHAVPGTAPGQHAPARPAAAAGAPAATSLFSRLGFGPRLIAGVLAASLASFLVTAIPLVQARREIVQREAEARAATIARAVGTENGPALASGQTLTVSVQGALAEPGVREALLLSPLGRVLAPVERMDETLNELGPFGKVSALRGLQTADLGGEVQAAVVVASGGRNLGIVWIRLDPSYASGGSPIMLYLLASLLTSATAAVLVGLLLRKMVLRRLTAFATDVDLATSGQLDVVTESFGLPHLAESVNFIVGRLRLAPREVNPVRPQAAPLHAPAPGGHRQGHLVLDASFIVKEVTPGAAELLQTAADRLQGRHILEAVSEQALVTAIIDLMGEVAVHGTITKRIDRRGSGPDLELQADRQSDGTDIRLAIRLAG